MDKQTDGPNTTIWQSTRLWTHDLNTDSTWLEFWNRSDNRALAERLAQQACDETIGKAHNLPISQVEKGAYGFGHTIWKTSADADDERRLRGLTNELLYGDKDDSKGEARPSHAIELHLMLPADKHEFPERLLADGPDVVGGYEAAVSVLQEIVTDWQIGERFDELCKEAFTEMVKDKGSQ